MQLYSDGKSGTPCITPYSPSDFLEARNSLRRRRHLKMFRSNLPTARREACMFLFAVLALEISSAWSFETWSSEFTAGPLQRRDSPSRVVGAWSVSQTPEPREILQERRCIYFKGYRASSSQHCVRFSKGKSGIHYGQGSVQLRTLFH